MATSGRGSGIVGYNVQVAVDTEHHLIITHEVTNVGNDRSQLSPVAKRAKATLEVENLDAVADRGYFDSEEIMACEEAGITVTLPKPMTSGINVKGGSANKTSVTWRSRTFTFALPVKGSPTTTRTKNMDWSCAAIAIFAIFDIVYEGSRALAEGQAVAAFRHGHAVVNAEKTLGIFDELTLQRWVLGAPHVVLDVANWTYFNCQFTISFAFLVWVYCRRNDSFYFIRNVVIAADFIGVIGYITYPTAPPRMLTEYGLRRHAPPDGRQPRHRVSALANPYAAMPSLHTAYAILIGTSGVLLARHALTKAVWALYPGLVVFSIITTANHFILDAVAGAATLMLALGLVVSVTFILRRRPLPLHVPAKPAPMLPQYAAAGETSAAA